MTNAITPAKIQNLYSTSTTPGLSPYNNNSITKPRLLWRGCLSSDGWCMDGV